MGLIDQEADHLLKKRNVVAVGLGKKWVDGEPTDEDAILVFVSNKVHLSSLGPKDLVPKNISGLVTDVVGRNGQFQALNLRNRQRPIIGGASCGHYKVTAGTMGCWFLDRDNDIVGLSNNHVLAWENLAKDLSAGPTKAHIAFQPGLYDDRNWRENKVGQLKSYRKLAKTGNVEDSAIALPYNNSSILPDIHQIGAPVGWNDNPKVGDKLQKSGRTTGYTTGKVVATDGVVDVQYSRRLGVLRFRDQILASAMSAGGDSGSCVLDMNNNVVGLLFAGSSSITILNRIKYPRETYGLKIYNPEPIIEDFSYSLVIDGVKTDGALYSDYSELLNRARAAARAGSQVSLSVNYSKD